MIRKFYEAGNEDNGGATQLKGQASEEQIEAWKAKYKQGIYGIEIDGSILYFQNPTRVHVNHSMSLMSVKSPLSLYEFLAKDTVIGGDEDKLKEDDAFFGITEYLKAKMDGKKGQLVNL